MIQTVRQLRFVAYKQSSQNYRADRVGPLPAGADPDRGVTRGRLTGADAMLAYLLRRLLHMIPLLLGITFLAFWSSIWRRATTSARCG